METTRTVVCKLAPTPKQAAAIDATLAALPLRAIMLPMRPDASAPRTR